MNLLSLRTAGWHKGLALIALCALILVPLTHVGAQAAPNGTITVNKQIVGTTTVPATAFSFLINGGSQIQFESDGSNAVSLAPGSYTVTESAAAGYTTSYSGCSNITLAASGTADCTITNTVIVPDPGTLIIRKIVMGTTSATADDFTFDAVRDTVNPYKTNEAFEADGTNVYHTQTGLYTITEDPAAGFVSSYGNSLNNDADCENLIVLPNATTTCTITNTASSTALQTGTLVIKKVVHSGGNEATTSFSFSVNGGIAQNIEADGTNVLSNVATGTYSIVETPIANYTPTYSNCSGVAVTAGATTTCTITNDFNVGGAPLTEIQGIVWNDQDEDGIFDGNESPLSGWTVFGSATGEITRQDTTDSNGHYSLLVTAGTWTISEAVQDSWKQTFPTDNSGHHVVVVANATSSEQAMLFFPLNLLVSVAHAQAAPVLYNFGNAAVRNGGGGGGNGVRISLSDNNNNNDDDDDSDSDSSSNNTPGGQVLGEATTVVPIGAPNTGAGGTSPADPEMVLTMLAIASLLVAGVGLGLKKHEEEES